MRSQKTFWTHLNSDLIEKFSASLNAHEHVESACEINSAVTLDSSYRPQE